MNNNFITVENISFAYPGTAENPVFDSLSAQISLSGNTLILGGNASGKTTLARVLGGLDAPQKGRIRWPKAENNRNLLEEESLRAGVVFEIPQFQMQSFTVKEELLLGLFYRGASEKKRRHALQQAQERFGMGPYLDRQVTGLTPAEQLAVLTVSFLLLEPSLLLLDFSLFQLDKWFRDLLQSQCSAQCGTSLVVTSRRADDLALEGFFQEIFLLERGRLNRLAWEPDEVKLVDMLERAGIRLPWYARLACGLHRKGLIKKTIYAEEKQFREEVARLAAERG